MLSIEQAIIATFITAGATYFTRLVPFVFFSKSKPSPMLTYLQQYIPPASMVILVIYSLKDIPYDTYPHGIPAFVGILLTFILHIWKNNPLLSIFGATAVYMALSRLLV